MVHAGVASTVLEPLEDATGKHSLVSPPPSPLDSLEIQWLPVRSLLSSDSPRLSGEDVEHTRMLSKLDERLPPIIVHRQTMRVIDGTHRVGAALLRGDEMIAARLFDGTEQEAFVLAVQTNIAHGLPLSLADRTRAAERIIASSPEWSDRAIASVTGLGARTVGNVRRRMQLGSRAEQAPVRRGLDGRVRPLDSAEGRLRAMVIIEERPEASLREIAREAGVSPTTVRDVRRRIESGEDPVPRFRRRRGAERAVDTPGDDDASRERALLTMLHGLRSDPSLRFTESGRTLLRWIMSRAVRSHERTDVAARVPSHCAYIIADLARAFADEWLQLANELERRNTSVG